LGIIVLEAMIGRVPFRIREDEPPVCLEGGFKVATNPQIVMWNKIICEPWDAIFREPSMHGRTPEYFGFDDATWQFIDAVREVIALH
jgi:hypothetical protein